MKQAMLTVKVGDKVRAIFRKYGIHNFVGEVKEMQTDEGGLPGVWVAILPTQCSPTDFLQFHVANHIQLLLPLKDIKEIL